MPVTSATLPAPAAMAIGVASMRSGKGSGAPTAALLDSWMSMYWPGCSATGGNSVSCVVVAPKLPVPVALAYWIDMPLRDSETVPRLKSSTKSCVYDAPAFPPPPYTWLMTRLPAAKAFADPTSATSALMTRHSRRRRCDTRSSPKLVFLPRKIGRGSFSGRPPRGL